MAFTDGSVLYAADLLATVGDTGWLTITAASGFTGSGSPAVRVLNGVAYYRGYFTGTMTLNTTHTLGTVPTEGRPSVLDGRTELAGTTSTGLSIGYMAVSVAGALLARSANATASYTVAIGGLSGYPVS